MHIKQKQDGYFFFQVAMTRFFTPFGVESSLRCFELCLSVEIRLGVVDCSVDLMILSEFFTYFNKFNNKKRNTVNSLLLTLMGEHFENAPLGSI